MYLKVVWIVLSLWLDCNKFISCIWAWARSGKPRIFRSRRWSKGGCVSCKIIITRKWAWSISATGVTSVWWFVWGSLRRAIRSRVSLRVVIPWTSVLSRSSSLFVITKTISKCRAVSVLWIVISVVWIISWCTSTSVSCIIAFYSTILRRTKVLYNWFLRFWSSTYFSFVFIISLFCETSWDGRICSVTIRAILFICRFIFVNWISRFRQHKLFLLWWIKSLCL